MNRSEPFGFLQRGLEKRRLCEENFRDSREADTAAERRQEVAAKGRLLRKAGVFRKSLPRIYFCIHLPSGLWSILVD